MLISWCITRGVVALPKSVTPNRTLFHRCPADVGITNNLRVISLTTENMKALDGLAAQGKQLRVNTPNWMTDFGFADWYGPGNRDAPEGAKLLAGKSAA